MKQADEEHTALEKAKEECDAVLADSAAPVSSLPPGGWDAAGNDESEDLPEDNDSGGHSGDPNGDYAVPVDGTAPVPDATNSYRTPDRHSRSCSSPAITPTEVEDSTPLDTPSVDPLLDRRPVPTPARLMLREGWGDGHPSSSECVASPSPVDDGDGDAPGNQPFDDAYMIWDET